MEQQFMFSQKEKKLLKYLPLILIVFAFAIFGAWLYVEFGKKPPVNLPAPTPGKESEIKRQLRELEALRGQSATFTEKEIKTQLKQLEALRKKTKTKPLSQDEIKRQLDELNQLRSQ